MTFAHHKYAVALTHLPDVYRVHTSRPRDTFSLLDTEDTLGNLWTSSTSHHEENGVSTIIPSNTKLVEDLTPNKLRHQAHMFMIYLKFGKGMNTQVIGRRKHHDVVMYKLS